MTAPKIRFDDGAAYERYMGVWSQLAGERFLSWLAPAAGWHWLDVGCGNGAFTEMLANGHSPGGLDGLDPSEAQLAYARQRPALGDARFHQGDAQALPFEDDAFDAAVMPLVIFFVPTPSRGVAEMRRVVRPGGTVAAYGWDLTGNGFPYEAVRAALNELGIAVPMPPSPEASRIDVLNRLWIDAGLESVETTTIEVQRTFADFDDYWATVRGGPSVGQIFASMPEGQLQQFERLVRVRVQGDATAGPVVQRASANAVKGIVPG